MGYHPLDPYSIPAPSTPYSQLPKPSRLKILYTPSLTPVLDSRIAKQVRAALDVLRGLGHEVVEKELEIPSIAAAWGLLMGSQLAATVRTAIVDKFGEDSLAKLERGVVNSWSFLDKLMTLEQTGNLHRQLFELNSFFANHIFPERGGFDLMITPGLPIPALGVNGKLPKQVEGQELDAEAAYGTMFPFNFLGLPSGVVRTPGRLEEWRETMGSMQVPFFSSRMERPGLTRSFAPDCGTQI